MQLLPGVRSHTITTERMRTHYLESGPEDGVPVVLVHGNLSTGRFFEHLLPEAPARYRFVVPDMRGFGDSEALPLEAAGGLQPWAEDIAALVDALGIGAPPHLAGWSTGGAAITAYARQRPVASLTLIDPVSPYGYGGVELDGTPCAEDFAGSGGGCANPEVVERLRAGDRSAESPLSPRNVMNSMYWAPTFRLPQEREDLLVDEMLKTLIGDDGYPGDATPSPSWPAWRRAPGTS